jgi:two-component system sensor histidine kinase PilS (NtrC family)
MSAVSPADRAPDRSDTRAHWRSLRYFATARVVVAAVLLAYSPALHGWRATVTSPEGQRFLLIAAAYLVLALLLAVASQPGRLRLRTLAEAQVTLDLLALTLLIDAGGTTRAGLAMLLILPNAGAAILMSARKALFFASLSSLLLLGVTALHWMRADREEAPFFDAGLIGAALMATVFVLNRFAARLADQERLAEQRGDDLQNQLSVTQAVISELPDGVVVLAGGAEPRAMNRAAREMLGPGDDAPGPSMSAGADTGLAMLRRALSDGRGAGGGAEGVVFTVPATDQGAPRRLRARILQGAAPAGAALDAAASGRSGGAVPDTVIVLEDLGRLEQRAQQLKLASMGRLSASIAHEIRNPLAAIRHANGLLGESQVQPGARRLSSIVEVNCLRIDRIIEDVLSISRRGAGTPEAIDAQAYLSEVVGDYLAQSGAEPSRVRISADSPQRIWFDAGNLRQVLLNLLGNALRHASAAPGAVGVGWHTEGGRAQLVVDDDGPGVPEAIRVHLFEPFFTTAPSGTGLGLHLARELCAANGASIRYRPAGDNPARRGAFVVEPLLPPSRP